jgi:hypothetical protein
MNVIVDLNKKSKQLPMPISPGKSFPLPMEGHERLSVSRYSVIPSKRSKQKVLASQQQFLRHCSSISAPFFFAGVLLCFLDPASFQISNPLTGRRKRRKA